MLQTKATGRVVIREGVMFNAVKVFSATMFNDRGLLGEKVSAWIAAQPPTVDVTEIVVTQSSDASFHCIALTVFYRTN